MSQTNEVVKNLQGQMHCPRAEMTCNGYMRGISEDAEKMIASLIEELCKPGSSKRPQDLPPLTSKRKKRRRMRAE